MKEERSGNQGEQRHGGRRRGAGRKAGTPNKRTREHQKKLAASVASGKTPLDYMLQRLRDESLDSDERMRAAVSAAPYVHPRLTAIDAKVSGDLVIEVVQFAERK